MRKHFLLLFLMTLLPFYGWAADGDITEPTGKTSLTYTGAALELLETTGSVEGINYQLRYAVTTTEATPDWSAFSTNAPKGTNAGKYYVYFAWYNTETQAHSTLGPKISVEIAKKALESGETKDYVAAVEATGLSYDGLEKTLIATAAKYGTTGSAAKCGAITYTIGKKNSNNEVTDAGCTYAATLPKATNAGTYYVYWKFDGSTNYAEVKNYVTVTIEAADITGITGAVTFNAESAAATRTYGGNWTAPSFTFGKYTERNIQITANVKWYTNDACTTPNNGVTPKNAGTYYAAVTGNGNFKGTLKYSATANDNRDWKFIVGRKQVRILVNPQYVEYNGQEHTPANAADNFTVYDLTAEDEARGVNGLTVEKVNATDEIKNAGKYYLKAKWNDNTKVGVTTTTPAYTALKLTDNYEPVALEQGFIEVKKKALTVTVNADKTIKYGAALPATKSLYYTAAGAAAYNATLPGAVVAKSNITAEEAAAYNALVTSGNKNANDEISADEAATANANLPGAVNADAATDYKTLVTINGIVKDETQNIDETNNVLSAISLGLKKQYDEEHAEIAAANYYNHVENYAGCWYLFYNVNDATLKNYEITPTNKNFIISGAGFTMMAVYASKEYDGLDASNATLSYLALDDNNNVVEIPKNVTVKYEYQTDAATDTWSTELPTKVGTYKYRVVKNPAYAPVGGNYDGNAIERQAATLKINPKKIKISVNPLTLHTGDNSAKLNQYASYTIDPTTPLVGKENLNVYYSFETTAIGTDNWDATTNKLKGTTTNPIANAISVRLVTAADYAVDNDNNPANDAIYAGQTPDLKNNGNYELVVTKGTLKIVAGTVLELDDEDMHVAEKLADANNTANATVTFTKKRIFRANKWYAIVLPFETTVRAFSTAMGYATVDMLDATKSTASFVQYVGTIPANTPFIFKVDQDINLKAKVQNIDATTGEETWTGEPVQFSTGTEGKIDFTTNINADTKNAEIPFGGGMLIGTYTKTGVWGTNQYYMSTDTNPVQDWVNAKLSDYTEENPRMIRPFRAILKFNTEATGAARIFIEEPDGSTTAIGGIAADGEMIAAEGWYTLNGVKLQGVPTQKGIYINNGKKIVIK